MDEVTQSVDSDSALSALPVPLLAEILQHVPQQQRLGQCALVCAAWALAAAQATVHVECKKLQPNAVAALQSWLAVHAGQLLNLKLSAVVYWIGQCKLQLPLAMLTRLQSLQLQDFVVQLPGEEGITCTSPGACSGDSSSAGSSHASTGPVLSSLQDLVLNDVDLADTSSLLQLTKAPQLTSLKFERINLTGLEFSSTPRSSNAAVAMKQVADAIPGLLQQLPQLSVLHQPGFPFTDAAVQQTAAMTRLQQLCLRHEGHMSSCDLRHLPGSITKLELEGDCDSIDSLMRLPPELPHLSGLLLLDLYECALPPKVLGSFRQLQELRMYYCRLAEASNDVNTQPQTPEEGTAALLDVLPKLTSLQDLDVHFENLNISSIAPQRWSALIASSQLTQLSMVRNTEMCLPKGAVQHMFPPGRQMQTLQCLTIITLCHAEHDEDGEPQWCMDSADILRITSACPQLQSLHITNSVQPGADLFPLLQLPESCTSLHVGGAAFTDAAVPVVLQLTQLGDLSWDCSADFTDAGLVQLTVLHLSNLCVNWCGLSEQIGPGQVEGSALEVWDSELGSVSQQLNAMCDSSPVCAPARLQKLRESLQAASIREEDLCQQLNCSHAEVERLRQQLKEAQERQLQ